MSDSEPPALVYAARKRPCLEETPSNTPDDCTQHADYSDDDVDIVATMPVAHPFFQGTAVTFLASPVPPVAYRTPPPRPPSADQDPNVDVVAAPVPLVSSPASCNFHEGPCVEQSKIPLAESRLPIPLNWPSRGVDVIRADDEEKVRLWNAVVSLMRKHSLQHKLVGDCGPEYQQACMFFVEDIRKLM